MIAQVSENKWEAAQKFGTFYGKEEALAMLEVLKNGAATNSSNVREFEKEFAQHMGGSYGVAANSWVGAANLLVIAMDIKAGDEIIIPALTFQASANIFVQEGAKIVFADINPRTFNIDADKLRDKITSKTKAIVVVHMCGQPADMDPILKIAKEYNLTVIQDAAHAHGALYKGRKLGELADYTIYSFHQGKNMSTLGEGGMVVTDKKDIVDKMKKLRAHGAGQYLGISSRMTDIQGAVGRVQLKRLDQNNLKRRELAYHLNKKLACIEGIDIPLEISDVYHVYHIYNIIIRQERINMSRDDFIKRMWLTGRIMAATQYYPTVNCLSAYESIGYGAGICPVAEEVSKNLVSLPISVNLKIEDMDEMAEIISKIVY